MIVDEKKVREAIGTIKSNYPTSGYYMLCEAFYECPSCGDIDVYGQKNCDNCGQRLDWSE